MIRKKLYCNLKVLNNTRHRYSHNCYNVNTVLVCKYVFCFVSQLLQIWQTRILDHWRRTAQDNENIWGCRWEVSLDHSCSHKPGTVLPTYTMDNREKREEQKWSQITERSKGFDLDPKQTKTEISCHERKTPRKNANVGWCLWFRLNAVVSNNVQLYTSIQIS